MRLSFLCALLALGPLTGQAAEIPAGQLKFFESKIRPVLVNQCYECHSAEGKTKGGLRVDTREDLMEGGESGPAIVPKDLKESLLLTAIKHVDSDLKMPKKRKLPERIIADFSKWILWMAGGGVKGGLRYGATDENGIAAVDNRVHFHDLHASILHQLGLDHEKLTYRYAGRDFRLTDVHGTVLNDILA